MSHLLYGSPQPQSYHKQDHLFAFLVNECSLLCICSGVFVGIWCEDNTTVPGTSS